MPSQNKLFETYISVEKLPIVAELKKKNKKLKKEVEEMKYLVVEMAKLNLPKLEKNTKLFNKIKKIDEYHRHVDGVENDNHNEVIKIKEEIIEDDEIMEIFDVKQNPNIVYEIEEDQQEQDVEIEELVIEEMEEEEVVEEVVEEQAEEVDEEQVEEEVVEEEEEQVEEEVEEEEVVEEEVVEEEVEEEEVEEEEEEGEEPIEVEINGKTYYALNNIDSIIYDVDANGDISVEVGKFINGKPKLNKK